MAALSYSKMLYSSPIIIILGATGSGKSKLAVELAKRFNGEVINADAMQMYEGLNIATNKMTESEKQGVPHHLLGFLDPLKKITVHEFRNDAMKIIKEITERKNLPIIVGGTAYYIESILYDILIDKPKLGENNLTEGILPQKKMKLEESEELWSEFSQLDNEELFQRLMKVDPERAKTLHPNDRRKIMRCLQVYLQHGETLSSILKKQRSQPGGCSSGGPLKFTNALILFLQCNLKVLSLRLNDRVDAMLAAGFVEELLEFHEKYNKNNILKNDSEYYHKGVFQSIGLKEFHNFLLLDKDERESEKGKKLFEKGIELMKIATTQYAKRQCKWIKNRLLGDVKRQVPPVYGLDTTDLSNWNKNIYNVAEDIVEAHLTGRKPLVEPLPIENTRVVIDKIYKCEICNKSVMGKLQWEVHLKGNSHSKMLKRKKKEETLQEELVKNLNSTTDCSLESSESLVKKN